MTALLAAAGVFAAWSVATAQTPGQADFDACNREAQSAIGSGSASPGTSGSTGGSMPGAGGTGGTSARPSMGPGAGRGSSGTTDGMGSSGTTGGAPSGGGPMGGAISGGAPSASDAQLQGMASAGLADPAYQQAYRDCMKRRGF